MARAKTRAPAKKRAPVAPALLVEILTEELPPLALGRLGDAFADQVLAQLREQGFVEDDEARRFASPRRLALLVPCVLARQPDRVVERKGPALKAGYDAAGNPTPALLGFAKSCGVDVARLDKQTGDKGEHFVFRAKQKGETLKKLLPAMVEGALKKLPVPKLMRWGAGDAEFVRPVHHVTMLHGKELIPGRVLDVKSDRRTVGHRLLSPGKFAIPGAEHYESLLLKRGKVIAGFAQRRETIVRQLTRAANTAQRGARALPDGTSAKGNGETQAIAQWILGNNATLVDEVCALVEYPKVYVARFDDAFLSVPPQCISLTMQKNQKYFPLVNAQGKLLPHYLIVSNLDVANPKHVIQGNERVLRARLNDARFFFEQDQKAPLHARVERLASVVYHNKLGSQLDRTKRVQGLARAIGARLGADAAALAHIERAAWLSKADLLTDMVGEFPELQGVMGGYYALHDGEDPAVAQAIEAHYHPRFAGDSLPATAISISVALADKLDTLVGIYGIGLAPTGEKDPFGLRRQALAVVRILLEHALALDLKWLIEQARAPFPAGVIAADMTAELPRFMLERLRPYLRDKGFKPDEIDAVVSADLAVLDQVLPRLRALQGFRGLPEAAALAAANKRIHNILRQAGQLEATPAVDGALLVEDSEKALLANVREIAGTVQPLFAAGNFSAGLKELARLRGPVDAFFDRVMVMVDDEKLRQARLSLLSEIRQLFLQAADVSRLQG